MPAPLTAAACAGFQWFLVVGGCSLGILIVLRGRVLPKDLMMPDLLDQTGVQCVCAKGASYEGAASCITMRATCSLTLEQGS